MPDSGQSWFSPCPPVESDSSDDPQPLADGSGRRLGEWLARNRPWTVQSGPDNPTGWRLAAVWAVGSLLVVGSGVAVAALLEGGPPALSERIERMVVFPGGGRQDSEPRPGAALGDPVQNAPREVIRSVARVPSIDRPDARLPDGGPGSIGYPAVPGDAGYPGAPGPEAPGAPGTAPGSGLGGTTAPGGEPSPAGPAAPTTPSVEPTAPTAPAEPTQPAETTPATEPTEPGGTTLPASPEPTTTPPAEETPGGDPLSEDPPEMPTPEAPAGAYPQPSPTP